MPDISVVIITFNEEKNIERCIQSVLEIADDIVVLDSFSSDQTEAICKSLGARFFQHKFDGHIEQKNRAITLAKYPHVLSIDADEEVSNQLKASILRVKEDWKFDGYSMNRLTNYCGQWIKHSGWYPDRKLRLWDSRKGAWKGLNPHDRYELHQGKDSVHTLKGDLLHYSYYKVEEHYKQAEYFSSIAAKAYFDKGIRANIFHLVFNPALKFVKNYFFKMGFLDGRNGFIICKITAVETYWKYQKLMQIQAKS